MIALAMDCGSRERGTVVEGHARRVLVIDDELLLAETIRLLLADRFDTETETSGKRALERLLSGESFHAILCDLALPDLSGDQIYKAVAAKHPEVAARFVFITGGACSSEVEAFLQSIPNPRLEKPFDLGALQDILSNR